MSEIRIYKKNLLFSCSSQIIVHRIGTWGKLKFGSIVGLDFNFLLNYSQGHLGFYEGGLICPNPVTYIDRVVVALIGGMVLHNHSTFHKRNEECL